MTPIRKKKNPEEDQLCCIVIRCGHPSADGKMAVEMSCEGDESLASYLLESAQGFIHRDKDHFSI